MTATATARAPAPATRVRSSRSLLGVAEVALAGVSLSAAFGLNRLFDDASFLPPLFWFVVAGHLVHTVCRRAGLGLAITTLASATGMALVVGWVLYPDTTWWGLPFGQTFDVASDDLSGVWGLFQEVKAPAPVEPGFLLVAGIALWISAYVADWAAFRLWVPFEAIVPSATVFVFGAMLGAPDHRRIATIVFLAAILGFLLAHRVAHQQASNMWLENDVKRGSNALLRSGAGLATIAVVIGVTGGPLLPGSGSQALVDWRNLDADSSSRQTISPLVQIRGRLVDQSEIELFSVTSSARAYWRLTSLDTFDGSVWSTRGSYGEADGDLPDTQTFAGTGQEVTQEFRIAALAAIWLPAAYEAQAIQTEDVDARWEAESSTLIVGRDRETSDDMRYDVLSLVPAPDPDLLSSSEAVTPPPDHIRDRFTGLDSGDVSDTVRSLAEQITAGAETPYEQALALQEFFREEFDYSLEVGGGHSGDAMEQFLQSRAGYCEQFAGTFAAMGRVVGLPTRVAVGFTPGDPDPVQAGVYHVRGKHAHAWPEVYVGSVGWVAFEPTPNRGAPNAEQWTGVPEQQVDSTNPGSATTLLPSESPGDTTPSPDNTLTPVDDGEAQTSDPSGPRPPQPNPFVQFWRRWGGTVLWVLGISAGMLALYAAIVPSARALRRSRRRRQAVEPDDRVRVAWAESVEALSVLGVEPRTSETVAEFAERAGRRAGGDDYAQLARVMEAAAYAEEGVDDEAADEARIVSDGIQEEIRQLATREQRLRAMFDPRPLLPRGTGRPDVRETAPIASTKDRVRVRAGV